MYGQPQPQPQPQPEQSKGVPKWAIGLGVVVLLVIIAYLFFDTPSPPSSLTVPPDPTLPTPSDSGTKPSVHVRTPQKWMFYQGLDSGSNDIGQFPGLDLPKLKAKCLSMPNCVGFNDNGWLKHTLRPKTKWVSWTKDTTKGFRIPTDRVTVLPDGGVVETD